MIDKVRATIILLMIIMMFVFSGCNKDETFLLGYQTLVYIDLFDYKSLTIDKDFVTVSDGEIEMVIEADLDSRGIYKEITDRNVVKNGDIILCDMVSEVAEYNFSNLFFFTDSDELPGGVEKELIGMKKDEKLRFASTGLKNSVDDSELYIKGLYTFAEANDEELVLDMYSCKSMKEVYNYVNNKTQNTIILNYALDKIFENSYIKRIPEEAEKFVENKEKMKEQYKNDIEFENYIGMTLEEYREYNYNIYFEYMIYAAIAEKEELIFTKTDFDETVRRIASSEKISEKEVLQMFDSEYIIFETISDEVEKVITSYVVIV